MDINFISFLLVIKIIAEKYAKNFLNVLVCIDLIANASLIYHSFSRNAQIAMYMIIRYRLCT